MRVCAGREALFWKSSLVLLAELMGGGVPCTRACVWTASSQAARGCVRMPMIVAVVSTYQMNLLLRVTGLSGISSLFAGKLAS